MIHSYNFERYYGLHIAQRTLTLVSCYCTITHTLSRSHCLCTKYVHWSDHFPPPLSLRRSRSLERKSNSSERSAFSYIIVLLRSALHRCRSLCETRETSFSCKRSAFRACRSHVYLPFLGCGQPAAVFHWRVSARALAQWVTPIETDRSIDRRVFLVPVPIAACRRATGMQWFIFAG